MISPQSMESTNGQLVYATPSLRFLLALEASTQYPTQMRKLREPTGQSQPTMNLCPRGAAAAQGLGERSRPDPPETAEGEGFEPSRDLTAPSDFRNSFHLAQPCALRPGARHNARQFAPRGLERTDRIGTMWASSRLLRLKIESQLREGALPSRLRGPSQPSSWSSPRRDSRNGFRRGREAHAQACAPRRRSWSPPMTEQIARGRRCPSRYVKSALSGGDTTLASQLSPGDMRESGTAADRVCAPQRTPPRTDDDSEFRNVPERGPRPRLASRRAGRGHS
jgi:hypothetical protein